MYVVNGGDYGKVSSQTFFFILASVIEPLLDRKLLLLLWKLMEDSESYIRASSICLLGVLSAHDVIWKHYCETISLSEVRNVCH